MSSTAKHRQRESFKTPKLKTKANPPSSSTLSSSVLHDPPAGLFPSKEELVRLVLVLTMASSMAFTCNFFINFFNPTMKPFCDNNLSPTDSLSDFCEPCPVNGVCNEGKLECVHGYQKHGKICIEDGNINKLAKKLSHLVENRVCEEYARFLCDGIGITWVQEDDIWKDLGGDQLMGNLKSDDPTYVYTKRNAMDITDRLLETRTNSHGNKELKCPDKLAEYYKPFSCRAQQWIFKHAPVIVPVLGSLLLFLKTQRKRYLSVRVEELYHQICEILEENALMSKRVDGENEPWVVASQLRDHLLLPNERKDTILWKKVEEMVQEDTRIDQYPKLVKGESKIVWEWQVEGSLSSKRMQKIMEPTEVKHKENIGENSNAQNNVMFNQNQPQLDSGLDWYKWI